MQNRLCEWQSPMYDRIRQRGLDFYVEHGTPTYTLYNSDDYHFHDVLEIGICVSGRGICCVNGIEYPYQRNSCQIVLPSIPHYTISTDTALSVWKWIFIEPRDFAALGKESDLINYLSILCDQIGVIGVFDENRFPLIAEDVLHFCDELNAPQSPMKLELCRLRLKIIFLHLLRASEGYLKYRIQIPKVDHRIQEILGLIDRSMSIGTQLSVMELSEQSGFSLSYFRSYFKRMVGVSPKEYMMRQAVRMAQEHLLSSDLSIESIASLVGFKDVSGLYRSFVAIHGISPMQYRQYWNNNSTEARLSEE